ncbi:hypothetical protein I5U23_10895 [Stenotrophomonas maltophilia]|uniref:Uncharacterized protein n=1 Tax=Stenotrophomonas riyadhensis TaxID=2859893 RepID=A0ABT2XA91_9GAMM|nr:hypothetical protein [Stenotrophomonas sp. CFS3442]MBH1618415.1 hypothetical protein [Stenotrophomonas maltophilia]MCV0322852.1 hypothetical protein [Stenotrophomonas sp. CFS3442]HEL4246880.1 hypothetical protein [Stenotrophomonas maltophilia]
MFSTCSFHTATCSLVTPLQGAPIAFGPWASCDFDAVAGSLSPRQRGLVVRALFETPRVIQPEKLHEFRSACVRCGDSEDWAGPDCELLIQKVDPRTRLPVEPSWFLEPLKWIRDTGPAPVSTHERRRRATVATFLIEKFEAHIEDVQQAMTQEHISHPETLPNCAAGHRARHIHDKRSASTGREGGLASVS